MAEDSVITDGTKLEQMENSIVHDFQNLQVLTAATGYDQMGDLVRDLTNALDDSIKQKATPKKEQQRNRRKGKRKSKKRKAAVNSSKLTDSKESSVEEGMGVQQYSCCLTHQSDSDEWLTSIKSPPSLSKTQLVPPQVESDSFTENFSPLQQQQPMRHRRRKFKRMAVDEHVCSPAEHNHEERSRSPVTELLVPGKRKRGVRCPGNSFDGEPNNEEDDRQMEQDIKDSTSSLSSSESSEVRYTGDDGQEGDDEQSDFFFEPGPEPGIMPWWEEERPPAHANLQQILTMSHQAQTSFKMRLKQLAKPGREYRSGRRCLKDRRPAYSLSRFLQDRQKWGDSKNLVAANTWHTANNGSADAKRRRKTPPDTPEPGDFLGCGAGMCGQRRRGCGGVAETTVPS